jgi:hypothetical protein
MKLFEYIDRISKMHRLIQVRGTGTPSEFARYLRVSRTSLYELIDEMKSRGAPIVYSKSARTFYYSQPYDITITCTLRPLTCKEEKENSGGAKLYSTVLFFRTLFPELSKVSMPC